MFLKDFFLENEQTVHVPLAADGVEQGEVDEDDEFEFELDDPPELEEAEEGTTRLDIMAIWSQELVGVGLKERKNMLKVLRCGKTNTSGRSPRLVLL